MAVGMEGEKQENAPVNLSAWGIASSFVTSFFDKFSQDVQTLKEKGLVQCASDVLTTDNKSNVDTILSVDMLISVEQVIEQAILTGATVSKDVLDEIVRKGIPVAQAALYPAIALSLELSGFHPLFGLAATSGALALSNPGRKTLMYATGGLVLIYALQHFPGVDGATATVGTPFQINQFSNAPVSVAVSQDGTKLCLATRDANSPPNVIGTIFNMDTDAVIKNITVSTTTASGAVYPRVSATQNGFGFGWTSSSSSPSVVDYRFYSNSGTASDAPIQGNQVATYGGFGETEIAGSTTQANAGFGAWAGSDGSGAYILGREVAASGTQSQEFIINKPPYVIGGDPCVVQQGDVVAAGWLNFNPNGLMARFFFPNGTFISDPVGLNQTAVSSSHVRCASLENNKVVFSLPVATGPAARITQNAALSGSQFSLGSGQAGATISLASCDSGAKFLSAFPSTDTKAIQLGYFDSSGNSLGQTSIPGANPAYTDVACKSQSTDCSVVWSNNSGTYGADVSLAPTPAPTPKIAPTPAPTPTSAASGLVASSFATLATSALLWYYGGN